MKRFVNHWALKGVGTLVVVMALLWFVLLLWATDASSAADRYRAELRSRGEVFDLAKLAPPRVPPQSNYAHVFESVAAGLELLPEDALSTNGMGGPTMVGPGRMVLASKRPQWELRDWATNTWEEIGDAVDKRSPHLGQLLRLPLGCRLDFDLEYMEGPRMRLSPLAKQKSIATQLNSSALYHLHRDQTDKAARNVTTVLTLISALDDQRMIISELVRHAMVATVLTPTIELLHNAAVNEAELVEVQRGWSHLEFVRPMQHTFELQRTMLPMAIALMRDEPDSYFTTPAPSSSSTMIDSLRGLGENARLRAAEIVWRKSWSFADERRAIEFAQLCVETVRRIGTNGAFKPELNHLQSELKARGLDDFTANSWLRSVLGQDIGEMFDSTGSLSKALDKMLAAEATRVMAVTAIALKRFQLRHGSFPNSLQQLVPDFLPHVSKDPVDGKPLRYLAKPDGTFVLYSVGADGIDSGGDATPARTSRSHYWLLGKDWVWPQPAADAGIEAHRLGSAAR
ncbi:MAG TPA: hypothetical protein VEH04_12880 [Verrucomicrobiae bacterium]|nr:hypothetical protein [Verrucomicrobiae bacterium]